MLPVYISYLLKLSLGLAAVYLFYRLVLQNLTFYNWNRWFLLVGTALAFIIPLVDVSGWLKPKQETFIVNYIPPVEQITTGNFSMAPVNMPAPVSFDFWNGLFILLLAGSVLLLLKTLFQFISFIRLRRRARLISNQKIKIYEVDGNIMPFSFGHSIFLNATVKKETDFQEIIRHELVHVQQNHTVDVLWLELVCILNWYNPFAWLLRHHVRQNLEFIADNYVLQTGTDKKHYQYLLLKEMGIPAFRLAHQFNFTSLKKRILMINKKPSPRSHLIKFSFLLPLVAVLLVSFRSEPANGFTDKYNGRYVMLSGLVLDATTFEPLANALVKEGNSNVETVTDKQGYYKLKIPASAYPLKTIIQIKKVGFKELISSSAYTLDNHKSLRDITFFGLVSSNNNKENKGSFISSGSAVGDAHDISTNPSYTEVAKRFEAFKIGKQDESELKELLKGSDKPYWVINGKSYVATANGSYASTDKVTDVVFVDGKKMTGKQVNETVKNNAIVSLGALEKEEAFKKYGIKEPVLEIYIKTKPSLP